MFAPRRTIGAALAAAAIAVVPAAASQARPVRDAAATPSAPRAVVAPAVPHVQAVPPSVEIPSAAEPATGSGGGWSPGLPVVLIAVLGAGTLLALVRVPRRALSRAPRVSS